MIEYDSDTEELERMMTALWRFQSWWGRRSWEGSLSQCNRAARVSWFNLRYRSPWSGDAPRGCLQCRSPQRGGAPRGHLNVCASAEQLVLEVARVDKVGADTGSSDLERRDFELQAVDVGSGRGPRLSSWPMSSL